jgi:serine/threonine protein kinase
MSPAPDMTDETIILNPPSNTGMLNVISSSDELDHNQFTEQQMDLGSLTIESMESIDLSDDDDDEPPTLTKESIVPFTIFSAPSTPTGERDPPIVYRRSSISSIPPNNEHELEQVEIKYQVAEINNENGNGLIYSFFGCLKPIFSAVNKIGENIKYTKDIGTSTKTADDWLIPIDSIMKDLKLIGTGIEGSVYLGKLGGQNVACKRVKSEEETNIKHLRKLNHINVVKFRGVSISSPLFYIVMEFCAYGSVFDVLRRRREKNSCTKPTQVLDWAKQISNGLNYLHSNKIVHRDVKSPNILIAENFILKISDFGTSKQLGNKQGQIMSFNGTSAWMAPEVIRQEPCSEKIDIWSFGIVLWEILTCEIPYHNIDPNAVMWGVGKGRLTLPIPSSVPNGLNLLMTMCWNQKPSNRPSFQNIIKHLNISESEIVLFEQEQEYAELTHVWSIEINEQLARLPTIDISATLQMSNDELMKKRKEELQHIADIRSHYETKLQQVNTLYIELSSLMMQLQKREQEVKKKERLLNIQHHSSTGNNHGKKRTINSILEARKKSLQLIKAASFNLNDPISIFSQTSTKKPQSNHPLSTNQPPVSTQTTAISTNSPDSLSIKTVQRRKKGPGHRRNNSKGSATSWTPPSLSAIADQEQKRASIHVTSNVTEELSPTNPIGNTPLPSISADVDSKTTVRNRQLNPKTLKLDLQNSTDSQITPTTQSRPSTIFTYALRKSSSSDPEDFDETQHQNLSRQQRRRRNLNLTNTKISSPSSATVRSIKSTPNTPQIDEVDTHTIRSIDEKNDNELRRQPRSVSFNLSNATPTTTERTPTYPPRKIFNRQMRYSSSEEGEVEEIPSDHYVFDDEKHRAIHEDLNRETNGIFSSESEIYNNHLSSLKNEGIFSDEGGHVSDDRPASRESLLNSEPEHEWPDQE